MLIRDVLCAAALSAAMLVGTANADHVPLEGGMVVQILDCAGDTLEVQVYDANQNMLGFSRGLPDREWFIAFADQFNHGDDWQTNLVVVETCDDEGGEK